MNVRIGIMGGTFNPAHVGHLIMAECARQEFKLSKVLFIPCAAPPHKPDKALPSAQTRLTMLEHAIAGNPFFEACEVEILRGGKSYSYDTLRELRAMQDGKVEFFFLVGSDSLASIMSWHRIRDLMKLCRFIVVERPGFEVPKILRKMAPGDRRYFGKYVLNGFLVEISSRAIRARVQKGLSVRYLVNEPVEAFITDEGLYRTKLAKFAL